jgi:hypothetical protein
MRCCRCHLQGSALDMLEDVNTGIAWVLRKVERYGGNPDHVWLVGQSAGGQLAMLALLSQAAQVGSRHSEQQVYADACSLWVCLIPGRAIARFYSVSCEHSSLRLQTHAISGVIWLPGCCAGCHRPGSAGWCAAVAPVLPERLCGRVWRVRPGGPGCAPAQARAVQEPAGHHHEHRRPGGMGEQCVGHGCSCGSCSACGRLLLGWEGLKPLLVIWRQVELHGGSFHLGWHACIWYCRQAEIKQCGYRLASCLAGYAEQRRVAGPCPSAPAYLHLRALFQCCCPCVWPAGGV